MWKKIHNSSLTIVLLAFFSFCIVGQFKSGFKANNEERIAKNLEPLSSPSEYLKSGHFISSVSENMESEFLQMSLFVYLTMFLIQKGSAESRKPEEEKTAEDYAKEKKEKDFCSIERQRHPILWRLYENSLTLSLVLLFVFFFLGHAYGSLDTINEDRLLEGKTAIRFMEVFSESDFWFESFQNWQSEFFSIAVMGLLSIFLRQKKSPQSKKMHEPHWKTSGT